MRASPPARLALFLTLSLALHCVSLQALPGLSLSSSPPLKKPVWVELVPREPPGTSTSSSPQKPARATEPADQTLSTAALARQAPTPRTVATREVGRTPARVTTRETRPQEPRPSLGNTPSPPDAPEDGGFGLSKNRTGRLPDEIEYEQYLLETKQRVEMNWKVSLDDDIREGTTVVWAVASEDGSLWSLDILEPSGMILHDYEALEAVRRAFPLLPPPRTLLNEKGMLSIHFSFHYRLPVPPS